MCHVDKEEVEREIMEGIELLNQDNIRTIEKKRKVEERGSLNKFPYFFRMGTFIDSTLMKL